MATPGQLVQSMADTLGLPVATVIQYDRQLAEGGLRSKGGRGTSAAQVTARDAANLLIAIAASPLAGPSIKEAVHTCAAYGSLKVLPRASWSDRFPNLGLPSMAELAEGHSLRDALCVLIDAAGHGEAISIPGARDMPADFCLSITFEGPRPWAEILADGSVGKGTPSKMARLVYASRDAGSGSCGRNPRHWRDLHQSRWISFATIRALGSLIARGPK